MENSRLFGVYTTVFQRPYVVRLGFFFVPLLDTILAMGVAFVAIKVFERLPWLGDSLWRFTLAVILGLIAFYISKARDRKDGRRIYSKRLFAIKYKNRPKTGGGVSGRAPSQGGWEVGHIQPPIHFERTGKQYV